METDNKQAVLTALNRLVNYAAYGGEPFFLTELYDFVNRDVASDINLLISQLCQSLGTTIEAETARPRGVQYEPLRYRAIPEDDVDLALETAIYNTITAGTDLGRMLRNKQWADRGIK